MRYIKYIFVILGLIVVYYLLSGVFYYHSLITEKDPTRRAFHKALHKVIRSKTPHYLITDLTPFEWETLWFYNSYSISPSCNSVTIEDRDYEIDPPFPYGSNETWNLFFIKGEHLVFAVSGRHMWPDSSLKNKSFSNKAIIFFNYDDTTRFIIKEGSE